VVEILDAPSCLGCKHHKKWSDLKKYNSKITQFDKCSLATAQGDYSGTYISTLVKYPHWFEKNKINPADCERRFVQETVKSNRMWVHLYFKGREKDWIVVEEDKHEILVQASWWVRKLFGVADKFHAWQDARAVKKAEKLVEKRKTILLTHIVKELPRL
jgi:hypothetical protein